ncbi:sorbosone dehydrogenase family protein [Microlunatus sp. Gsoil 973]|uniref:PQQ-dependent sugar dehydrogenase n=1 Tax=Microlunatus sp. Gsoil 973 TaxID=2672569 RepID=UPI0012B48B2F|nr:PQQ-dependent sugar dehydrogenase [Microlunatus sp. Gsoil 973]QGN33658.1 PQQ-dependent sugar dehydrogenase [Microlunatus sp. Gsoil 973]
MITRPKMLLAGAVATATLVALLNGTGSEVRSAQAAPASGSVRVIRTVLRGENVPWGMARLPGGDIVYTTRDTHLVRRLNLKTGTFHTLGRIKAARSQTSAGGEGGLLGIAVDPDFARTHLLYVYYSTAGDNRVARVHYYTQRRPYHRLGRPEVIVKGIPHGIHHNGGQLKFGPRGRLYISTGEAGNPSLAQNKHSLGGKILRVTRRGKPVAGNPIAGSRLWTWGHRNVQGLAWDGAHRLWASEFGDRKADELNLIRKGHNYGWPATQGRTSHKGYTSPVAQWGTEVDSPSGIAFTNGVIWMAALKGERLWRIPMSGTRTAAAPTAYLIGRYGRLRSVLWIGSGRLLVTTSNTDGRGAPNRHDDRVLELSVR